MLELKACDERLAAIGFRPYFSRQLPDDVKLSIVVRVGHWASHMLAPTCREFRATVKIARELRIYGGKGLSISNSRFHTVMCTMGRVYTCGGYDDDEYAKHDEKERNRSFLGHGDVFNEMKPKLVEALVGVNVVGVAAGHMHTVVWTEEGEAYSFGDGADGKLGHKSRVQCGGHYPSSRTASSDDWYLLEPTLIEGPLVGKRVAGVAAGQCHTVVWTEKGEVYSFGYGRQGRLGHGGIQNEHVPRMIEGALVGKRVVGVAAGSIHTVVWTEEGEAYSFGGGGGQLGHGGLESELVPRLIEGILVGKRVVGAAAGYVHTVVWTEQGGVYSFGTGDTGKLGHGPEPSYAVLVGPTNIVPKLIEGPLVGKRVVGATVGMNHTVVWTEGGNAYSFGYAYHGRSVNGGYESIDVPNLIEGILVGKRVVGASVTSGHSVSVTVLWTDEDKPYSFGWGKCGQLGHGGAPSDAEGRVPKPVELPAPA